MPPQGIVIADSSVLINFLAIDRMDLIGSHPSEFLVTNHVADEITYVQPERYERFQEALAAGVVQQIEVNDATEIEIFGELSGQHLGPGESSAIAVALNRGFEIAIDDTKAIRAALERNPDIAVLRTQDLILDCIRLGILDIAGADAIKDDWSENHRFILKLDSFGELLKDNTVPASSQMQV